MASFLFVCLRVLFSRGSFRQTEIREKKCYRCRMPNQNVMPKLVNCVPAVVLMSAPLCVSLRIQPSFSGRERRRTAENLFLLSSFQAPSFLNVSNVFCGMCFVKCNQIAFTISAVTTENKKTLAGSIVVGRFLSDYFQKSVSWKQRRAWRACCTLLRGMDYIIL